MPHVEIGEDGIVRIDYRAHDHVTLKVVQQAYQKQLVVSQEEQRPVLIFGQGVMSLGEDVADFVAGIFHGNQGGGDIDQILHGGAIGQHVPNVQCPPISDTVIHFGILCFALVDGICRLRACEIPIYAHLRGAA